MSELIELTPTDYNLPHEEFRPGQLSTINWLEDQYVNGSLFSILNAPTGMGKTAFSAALQSLGRVVALCKTKSLQSENYDRGYGATALYGKSNYRCVHDHAVEGATANECLYTENMYQCEVASNCHYLQAKEEVKQSRYISLNYAYWLSAAWVRNHGKFPIDILFLDEAHQLSDVVLGWAGCTINESIRRRWDLPEFPLIIGYSTQALDWLNECLNTLEKQHARLTANKDIKRAMACQRLMMKIKVTISALNSVADDWYVRSGKIKSNGRIKHTFIARPLTARHHFYHYFGSDQRLAVPMSATIGNVETFTNELGISDLYDYNTISDIRPPDTRPIIDLNAPRIGHKTKPHEHAHQARLIAQDIKSMNPEWSGVIHVNSKRQAHRLAERLGKSGLSDRVWVTPEKGTDIQLRAWEQRKRKKKNSIVVAWSFWEGVDMLDERLCYVAKVPFINRGDPYELARMQRFPEYAKLRVAQKFEQGLGRTRRGNESDYDIDGRVNGRVVIADGNWRIIKGMLSENLRGTIVDG